MILLESIKPIILGNRGKITARFSQGFINPQCVFWGYKKMTRARSWPVFAQSFDTPPHHAPSVQ